MMNKSPQQKYYEFKIFLDENLDGNDESLAFHACIANKKEYRIIEALHSTYSDLFKKVKDGEFIIKYINNKEYLSGKNISYKSLVINGDDAIENLHLFAKEYRRLFSFNISLSIVDDGKYLMYKQPPSNADSLGNYINQDEKRKLEERFSLELGYLTDAKVEEYHDNYFIGDVNITCKENIEEALLC